MTHWGANRNRWSSLTSCTGRFLHRLNWERRVCHARYYCLKSACSATGRWNYVCTISWGAWGNISTQAWSSARFLQHTLHSYSKAISNQAILTYSALPRLQIYSKYVGLCLKPEKRARHFENCGGNFYHIYKTFTWRLTSHLRSILIFCYLDI